MDIAIVLVVTGSLLVIALIVLVVRRLSA